MFISNKNQQSHREGILKHIYYLNKKVMEPQIKNQQIKTKTIFKSSPKIKNQIKSNKLWKLNKNHVVALYIEQTFNIIIFQIQYLDQQKTQCVQQFLNQMGCQTAKIEVKGVPISISIVDQSFMKSQNASLRQKFKQNNIHTDYYISVECFLDEFRKIYVNQVVVGIQNYQKVNEKLQRLNFYPRIYVIGKLNIEKEEFLTSNIIMVENYTELIEIMIKKGIKIKNNHQMVKSGKIKKNNKLGVKILQQNKDFLTSEEIILESALKAKNISYEIYQTYQQLQQSTFETDSYFIVTDYVYHYQVIELVKILKTKVICSCKLSNKEAYHPDTYFISNNFMEISSEIVFQMNLAHMKQIKCSKIYLYQNGLSNINDYKQVLESFGLEVRLFSDINKVIRQTTYFFCTTVLAAESEMKKIQKILQKTQYSFKVKLITIESKVEPRIVSMRKVIKECKKGYQAQKGVTKSIDIIDKHYNSVKFEEIKKELENNNIICFGYKNLNEYISNKNLVSAFIICNFEQKFILLRYLQQIQSSSRIIVFCNKNKITHEVTNFKQFSFVSSHFGKILTFINKNHILRPFLVHENDKKINEKVEKLKNKNKRISALKWCGLTQEFNNELQNDNSTNEEQFQFINISKNTEQSSIKELQKDAALLWKLDYKPFNNFANLKNDLAESFGKLRKLYKINYPINHFNALMQEMQNMPIGKLITKVREFFDSENQLGLKINNNLLKIETLATDDILTLRQFIFFVNLNYISIYKMPRLAKIRLNHWTSKNLIEKCEIGSFLFNKNYFILYEQQNNLEPLSEHQIVIEIQYNTILCSELHISPFFKHKDKYIFSPYSQFVLIEVITHLNGAKIFNLEYVPNNNFLKQYISDNIANSNNLLQIYKNATQLQNNKISSLIDENILPEVRMNCQRLQSLNFFKSGDIQKAINIHKSVIKEEEQQQNLNSVKISQLSYELACFYIKNNNHQQASSLIQEILDYKPGKYITQNCEKLNQEGKKGQIKEETKQQMKEEIQNTFTWLNQKQEDEDISIKEYQDNKELRQLGSNQLREAQRYDNKIHCLEIYEDQNEKEHTKYILMEEDNKENNQMQL